MQMKAAAITFKSKPAHIIVSKEDAASFMQAQSQVADYLQTRHYRSFLLSEFYRK